MALNAFLAFGPLRALVLAGWRADARSKTSRLRPHLRRGERILDIGTGYGFVADGLRSDYGFDVHGCDILDTYRGRGPRPTLFDGNVLPYTDDSYDVALLLTVLHHVEDQEALLSEARRVARRVMLIEDVYEGQLQRRLTFWADSVFNFQFIGHPHSNRTDEQWRALFSGMGFNVDATRSDRYLGFFRQATYVLSRRRQ